MCVRALYDYQAGRPPLRAQSPSTCTQSASTYVNCSVISGSSPCYHAVPTEDESELSFEPGDIIRDVETVDKAWWKGRSKDGRQGLFPANYVETI